MAAGAPLAAGAAEPAGMWALAARAPMPPWPAGDERGMANVLGEQTTRRCAWHMSRPHARTYEASFERSNTMPKSPFAPPSLSKPKPTAGVPFSAHAFNSEAFEAGAEPQQQGTQIDALGHFASIQSPWDPKNAFSADGASYYGGYKQQDVKPTPDSPLLKLGIEKIPPLITTAVLLDARTQVGKGRAMGQGQLVTAADIEAMLKAQGLGRRGLLPGDMVWIYTGWSENWKDPADANSPYYAMAPGLSVDAAKMLAGKRIVAVGLDVPFIDPVPEGMLQGKAPPAPGTEQGLPFSIHHYMLSVYGIHHLENLNLAAMAADKVWTSCAMVLPSRDKGAAGAVIRPVAIGVPHQR
ncbi:cyclase family protein [Ramlibacter sp. USB13]|uniref:Cyclase family protein n=1 Tax=Ramlibacter cellulosilyticus TaxID=2764187 RepID=A0A923SAI9_9BURK|nr:cyclase family protein [Ramlibacter cellulosilyticus]